MNEIYKADLLDSMTLIICAFQNDNVYLCADSMLQVVETKEIRSTPDKIVKINYCLAVTLNGRYKETVPQFIKDYVRSVEREYDFDSAFTELKERAGETLQLSGEYDFDLSLIGFRNGISYGKRINVKNSRKKPLVEALTNEATFFGHDNFKVYARDKYVELEATHPDRRGLIYEVCRQTIEHFPTELSRPITQYTLHKPLSVLT